jgi:dCTP deaminase
MTLLSDRDILKYVETERLAIDPYDEAMVQPSSVDVRLDDKFIVFDNHLYSVIDPAVEQEGLTREVHAEDHFILHPGEFVLASTYESVGLPDFLAARMEGKSSLGRLGLLTHATAGFIDPGFSGHVTLELSNVANLPIVLYPGMKIGQLCFFEMSTSVINEYGSRAAGSHYQGQRGPTPSRSWQKFQQIDVHQTAS